MPLILTNSFNVTDNATLKLDGASYVTTALVGGITYVFVAGKDDNGVSVFSLGADGTLTNVFNFADNGADEPRRRLRGDHQGGRRHHLPVRDRQ